MRIELINTGSELTLGRVLNTHLQWLGRRLAELGWPLERQSCVPDTASAIREAVVEAIPRADIIVTTGGLGPTSDDLTRDEIARLFEVGLAVDARVLANIEGFFTGRGRPMPESTRVQALVPEGATVLHNGHGTAPGLALRIPEKLAGKRTTKPWLIMLPGPPRELYPMFIEQVVPLLSQEFPRTEPFACLTLRTAGLGESIVEERIAPSLKALTERGLDIGYCARMGEVEVRLLANGTSAETIVADGEKIVREKLGHHIYGIGDETLELVVVKTLSARRQTLAVAESCTGGLVGHRITNVPGASEVFRAGLITYSNEAKQTFLGVKRETLEAHGAVSEQTALEMAAGVRRAVGTDFGVAVTGIAGPGGGSPEKPVGTVFIGMATPTRVEARKFFNPVDRETFKLMTSYQALNMLRLAAQS